MKVKINYLKISDSPFDKDNESPFVFENETKISQIEQELYFGNPTCFLVSGYRGAGKTSFIRKIEYNLTSNNNSDVVFIYANILKYDDFSLILRKIIRGVYLSFHKENYKESLQKLDERTSNYLKLLFQKTFFDVISSSKESVSKEKIESSKLELDVKKLLILFFLVLTIFNLKFNLINLYLPEVNVLIFVAALILAVINYFKIEKSTTNKISDNLEMNSKELYDDEIAEYHILTILKNIRDNKIKLIFVFDELDKIEDANDIELLITGLKPIMLSGLASFLLVTGQRLSYRYNQSHMMDDSIISSVFSKIIHVPLLSSRSFIEIFENLLLDRTDINNKIVKFYVSSLILSSNKIPRRFLNLIRKDIVWENNNSYLEINDEDLNAYETDSELLNIIDKIGDNEISGEYDEVIKDFLVSQLLIWSRRMKLKKSVEFTAKSIYNLNEDYSPSYPKEYLSQLDDICTLLLDRMVENRLLELREDDDETKVYKWIKDVKIKSENFEEDALSVKSKFLEQFIDLEKFVRDIYIDLIGDYTSNNRKLSLEKMLIELSQIGILPEHWSNNKKFSNIIELRNKIEYKEEINVEDIDINIAQEFRFALGRLNSEILEEYTFYITKKHLQDNGYNLSREPSRFDFVAIPTDLSKTHILFEVKYDYASQLLPFEILRRDFLDFSSADFKKKHLIICYYLRQGSFDTLINKFYHFIETNFPQLNGMISILIISDVSSGRLISYLNQVINEINNKDR